ncbi:hypothetical protein V3481_017175 [Fusarium oxysporum f. sp. vasinfectum]
MDQLSVDRTIHRKRHSGATPTITGERTPKYESAYIEFRGSPGYKDLLNLSSYLHTSLAWRDAVQETR